MEEVKDLLDLDTSTKDIHIREDEHGHTGLLALFESSSHDARSYGTQPKMRNLQQSSLLLACYLAVIKVISGCVHIAFSGF